MIMLVGISLCDGALAMLHLNRSARIQNLKVPKRFVKVVLLSRFLEGMPGYNSRSLI